jgi:hypothetical protein
MPFSDTVKRVIDLANAVRDYWDTELPKRYPTYPLVPAGADDGLPPPEEKELETLLRSLPPADVYKLMSLMYLGREDFNAHGWEPMSRELRQTFPDPDRAIQQMMAKGPLGEYLADGLAQLTAHGTDVDKSEGVAA